MMNKRDKLIQYSMQYNGDWTKITKAIRNNEPIQYKDPITQCITYFDEEYPDSLRQLRYPPWVLFYIGDISLLKKRSITIVGSRDLNDYGKQVTSRASKSLCHKYVIVSGLAKGADSIAHQQAITNHGQTIGVIASGLEMEYPKENQSLYQIMKKEHLIISEYPYHTKIQKHHFIYRNRILAALGDKCIVTASKLKSGTMFTVNEAMNLGKEVWCFPYAFDDIYGEGNNKLIHDGAMLLYDMKQLSDL